MSRELVTVREINKQCSANAYGGSSYGVYAQVVGFDHWLRVIGARETKGLLQVQTFHGWKVPQKVEKR